MQGLGPMCALNRCQSEAAMQTVPDLVIEGLMLVSVGRLSYAPSPRKPSTRHLTEESEMSLPPQAMT